MDNETNIRAAKALGAKAIYIDGEEEVKAYEFPENVRHVIPTIYLVKYMKFTTSYDWAMLGVKHLRDNIKPKRGYSVMAAFYTHTPQGTDWWDLSPEQITQAWVEVLEAQNGQ